MAKTVLGIDVGYDSLKLALVKGRQVKKTAVVPMPNSLIRAGRVVSVETMGDLLRTAMKQNGLRCDKAALALPNETVFIRNVTMPIMTEDQLKYNLPFEFRDYITDELKGYVFDYAMIGVKQAEESSEAEDAELERRELRARARRGNERGLRRVDREGAEDERLRRSLRRGLHARAPQERRDARAQLREAEGLREIVVRAEAEPRHLVLLGRLRRQHQDRHRPVPAADLRDDIPPGHLRHHHVEDHEVGTLLRIRLHGRRAVVDGAHPARVALKRHRHPLADLRIVFGKKDVRHFSLKFKVQSLKFKV